EVPNNNDGVYNIFIGDQTGGSNRGGSENIFIGKRVGISNITGKGNLFMGRSSGFFNRTGSNNIFLGESTGTKNKSGHNNIFLGRMAGISNTRGSNNIAIGENAGSSLSGGRLNERSSSSIFLGKQTKSGGLNSSNEIVIGDAAQGAGTNTATLGNTNITDTYLHGNIFASGTQITVPDYVFQKYYNGVSSLKEDYKMPSLKEVASFTRKNKHLSGVLSAKEIKERGGIILNNATTINLEKIEELFLHAIAQEKKIETQEKKIEAKEKKIKELEGSLSIQQKELEKIKAFLKLK
ncbi:MAG: hypothetical protein ACWIPI_01675, partial [Polaribacter sp.]